VVVGLAVIIFLAALGYLIQFLQTPSGLVTVIVIIGILVGVFVLRKRQQITQRLAWQMQQQQQAAWQFNQQQEAAKCFQREGAEWIELSATQYQTTGIFLNDDSASSTWKHLGKYMPNRNGNGKKKRDKSRKE
jgi:type II secretory pathway pseudopilin PulG